MNRRHAGVYDAAEDAERGFREGVKAPGPRGRHRGHSDAEAHASAVAAVKGRIPTTYRREPDEVDAVYDYSQVRYWREERGEVKIEVELVSGDVLIADVNNYTIRVDKRGNLLSLEWTTIAGETRWLSRNDFLAVEIEREPDEAERYALGQALGKDPR